MTPFRQRALVTALIGLGLLIVGFFGFRTIHALREFRSHRPPPPFETTGQPETDVDLIRDWMTIGFISHMYRVHPRLLYEALDIRPNGNEEKSLKQLNDEYFPDHPDHVLQIVKAAIQANPSAAVPPSADTGVSPATALPSTTIVSNHFSVTGLIFYPPKLITTASPLFARVLLPRARGASHWPAQ